MKGFLRSGVLWSWALAPLLSMNAQTVGIGIDAPTATLDVRTGSTLTSVNVERTAPGPVGTNAAMEIRDLSDYSVMEIYQNGFFNNEQVVFISNAGRNNAIWGANLNTGNVAATALFTTVGNPLGSALELQNQGVGNTQEVLYAYHAGLGLGLLVELGNAANATYGIEVTQEGTGDGILMNLTNTSAGNIAAVANLFSNDQVGFLTDATATSAWGLYNLLEDGIGVYNYFADNDGYSVFTDMLGVDGSGYFFTNIDLADYFGSGTVTGSGDGFALDVFLNTASTSVGSLAFGGVIGADQFGVGHGILLNHHGTEGRNAEFNILDENNPDPAIFATSAGSGTVIYAQQESDALTGTVAVAQFNYTGADLDDHIGVSAVSAPGSGYGLGGRFTGGYVGVYGEEGSAGALAGVYAAGDVAASGTKPFIIDHPLDPENRYLRHFAIESNEVLNLYRGVATIGRSGRAVVQLPPYFDALNVNVTYQLTAIGSPVQPYISREVSGNVFEVAGAPGSKVSWTIYANRNDAYVQKHPHKTTDEFPKEERHQGRYIDPASHGLDASRGIFYRPETVQEPVYRAESKKPVLVQQRARSEGEGSLAGNKPVPTGRFHTLEYPVPHQELERTVNPAPRMEIRRDIRTWDELR